MNSGSTHLLSSVEKPTLYFLGTSLITVVGKVGTSLDSLLRNWNVLIGTRLLIGDSSIGGGRREQDKTLYIFISIGRSAAHSYWKLETKFRISVHWIGVTLPYKYEILRNQSSSDQGKDFLPLMISSSGSSETMVKLLARPAKLRKDAQWGVSKKHLFKQIKQKAEPTTHFPLG